MYSPHYEELWLFSLMLGLSFALQACRSAGGPESSSSSEKNAGAKPGKDKAFAELVKDMRTFEGLFTFYRDSSDEKTYMELKPEQMDSIYLIAITIDRAIGERGLYAAAQAGDGPIMFRQRGKNVQLILKNASFTATPGTPEARMTERSFADAILGTAKILSAPHPERKSILVDVSDLFMGDLPGFAPMLNEMYKPSVYRYDKEASFLETPRAFPENILLGALLHYRTDNPKTPSVALPDARSIPIEVRYEISTLKNTGYQPRLADDRVGHFLNVRADLSNDRSRTPEVRNVARWHLEKADSTAALSEPKEPIVFWLENTVPEEYRAHVRDGILMWNKAFERIGFKNAMVVKQQPDTADWDPADTRYNTIRWFAGVGASFAQGPSRANPFTGQIYDADIRFSESMTRFIRSFGKEFVDPVTLESEDFTLPLSSGWNRHGSALCTHQDGMVEQAAFAAGILRARGSLSPEMEEKLVRQFLVEVTAHEVGHTLGLRHNFRASTMLDADELMNVSITSERGQSGSVMDYNPYVVAAKGEQQGDFVPTTLGPYDYWAIEYAYKPIAGDEAPELMKIASRAPEPDLTYATDEDALGTYSPSSIDPLVNQFDQSSDPLKYFSKRLSIVRELWDNTESSLAEEGEGYQAMRRAVSRGLSEYTRSLLTSSKFIGGIYHSRHHVGDPNGSDPYVPVPPEKQREALAFLKTYAFSDEAFTLPAGLHRKLAIDRLPGLSWMAFFGITRLDYPWHNAVLARQAVVLGRLYHPITLARIQDSELMTPEGEKPFTMLEMFQELDRAIWSELERGSVKVSSLRRNLQREHTGVLTTLALRTGGKPPEDATTFARASLEELSARIRAVLNQGVADRATRAHLKETRARIDQALEANVVRDLK